MTDVPPAPNEAPAPADALAKPLLIYDGDCGFCRRWVDRWRITTGDRVDYAPYQQVADRYPQIPRQRFQRAVQLMEPNGTLHGAAKAVLVALALGANRRAPLWWYEHIPGVSWVCERLYQAVARLRPVLSLLTLLLWGRRVKPTTYVLVRRLFERGLCLIYLIAFLSLGTQITGLVGENGILPLSRFLDAARGQTVPHYYWRLPTLAWLDSSDGALRVLCGAGAVLSGVAFLRIAPGPIFLVFWILYLSLVSAGQVFLNFQWDALLLEAGLLAVFLAPWKLRATPTTETPPSRIVLWLVRLLLFRLMFLSGQTKLLSGDEAWRNLAALNYHYWTQCIPTSLAWYANQLPDWFQKESTRIMFFIELYVPFLIFLPRIPRLLGFWALAFLQIVILLTGNYTFFNWLTLVLCLTLLEDSSVRRLVPRRWRGAYAVDAPRRRPSRLRGLITVPVGLFLGAMGAVHLYGTLNGYEKLPERVNAVRRAIAPFRSVNSYGLFRTMTKTRREIILEGSNDGREWAAYEFKWKPGDPRRPPPFVAPHQPRLDWQMWFAALGNARQNPWVLGLMDRLLRGSHEVLGLLEYNPFPDSPPRYLRAVLYDYHFTDPAAKRLTGVWWKRDYLGVYVPPQRLPDRNP